MYKNETALDLFDVKSNENLIKQVNDIINNAKDDQVKKVTDIKKAKFSYPKNGLYGLL